MSYPHSPGWKENDTAKRAANEINPRAVTVRELVFRAYKNGQQFTADEVAHHLHISILTVRPRVTELFKQGKLVDTGLRRRNDSGMMAKVLKVPAAAEHHQERLL